MLRQQSRQLFSSIRLRTRSRAAEYYIRYLTPIVRSYSVGLVASNVTFRCAMAINYLCAFMSKRAFGKKTWLLVACAKSTHFGLAQSFNLLCVIFVD